jgi:hypothetical protein
LLIVIDDTDGEMGLSPLMMCSRNGAVIVTGQHDSSRTPYVDQDIEVNEMHRQCGDFAEGGNWILRGIGAWCDGWKAPLHVRPQDGSTCDDDDDEEGEEEEEEDEKICLER